MALLLVSAPAAFAEERFDHQGALGFWVQGGVGVRTGSTLDHEVDGGLRFPLELGGFGALPDTQNGLWVLGRVSLGRAKPEWAVLAGYRGFFGKERWKTFYDLGGVFVITPRFAVGPRVGVGVQYEFSPVVGLFLAGGAEIGGGNGFHFGGDVGLGLELRTYLLE